MFKDTIKIKLTVYGCPACSSLKVWAVCFLTLFLVSLILIICQTFVKHLWLHYTWGTGQLSTWLIPELISHTFRWQLQERLINEKCYAHVLQVESDFSATQSKESVFFLPPCIIILSPSHHPLLFCLPQCISFFSFFFLFFSFFAQNIEHFTCRIDLKRQTMTASPFCVPFESIYATHTKMG